MDGQDKDSLILSKTITIYDIHTNRLPTTQDEQAYKLR